MQASDCRPRQSYDSLFSKVGCILSADICEGLVLTTADAMVVRPTIIHVSTTEAPDMMEPLLIPDKA
jgi:hypothetical protein